MNKSAYEHVSKYWLIDFYNCAYENVTDKIPVVVPSYNRYENNRFLNNVRKNMHEDWPIYVVVRQSQKKLYEQNYGDLANVTFVAFKDEDINNIGKTRIKIVEYFTNRFDNIMTVDDDIQMIVKTKAVSTDPTRKIQEKLIENTNLNDPARIFAMWQLIHNYLSDKYEGCYCTYAYLQVFMVNVYFSEEKSYRVGGKANGAVCLNLKRMKKYKLNYLSSTETGHEDIDLVIRAMDHNLYPVSIRCINYKTDFSDASVITQNMHFNTVEERMQYQNELLLNKYSNNQYIKGCSRNFIIFNWNKYLNDIGFDKAKCGSLRKEFFNDLFNNTRVISSIR